MKCPSCKSPTSPVSVPWPFTSAGGGFIVQCSMCQTVLGVLPNLSALDSRIRAIEQHIVAELIPATVVGDGALHESTNG